MDVLAKVKELVLPAIEIEVKKQIELNADKAVDIVLEKLKELIPGHVEDGFIALNAPKLKEVVKAKLLEVAEKIS